MPTRNNLFVAEMFDSDSSTVEETKENGETTVKNDNWKSYFEFIAFCIGKHSILMIYVHFQYLNFVEDFIIYLLVGIPVCYMQLLLGQYTQVGIFLIRRMLPIAQGISYVYILTIFTLTVIIVSEIEDNLVYFILSITPKQTAWNICPNEFKDICWNFKDTCTVEHPCMDENKRLPTYIFWNYTFMGGAYPMHKAALSLPERYAPPVTIICWLAINITAILSFAKIKKVVQIFVTLSVLLKIMFILLFGSKLGYLNLIVEVLSIRADTWLNLEAWKSSISRVISSMMLGDFTYIMFGVYTTYSSRTGTLSCVGAIAGYCILLIEIIIIKGAIYVLVEYSKIDPSNYSVLFVPHAPDSLIIVPAALGVSGKSTFWITLYFLTNIITNLIWCVINITFMQQSLYQRFTNMKSYYKYTSPIFCLLGFIIGICSQTKEIYEIRFDFTLIVDSFCQYLNLILLTFMVIYVYGFRKLSDDIRFMTGKEPTNVWKITWVLSPIIMMLMLPYQFLNQDHPFFRERIATILIVFSPFYICGIVYAIKRVYNRDLFGILKSHPLWGPKDDNLRAMRNSFQPRQQTKYKQYSSKCAHQCLLRNEV